MQFDRQVWSGEKVLIAGLAKKGVTIMLTTDELYNLREATKRGHRRRKQRKPRAISEGLNEGLNLEIGGLIEGLKTVGSITARHFLTAWHLFQPIKTCNIS